MGDAKAAKRPRLDTTRLDSEVWMLKCPQFISQSWTSIDLLQEKDAVRRTDAAQEFKKRQFIELNYLAGTTNDIWWNLEDTSPVQVMCFRTQNAGSNSGTDGQGADMWCTTATTLNYVTDNKWPRMAQSTMSSMTATHALESIAGIPKAMSNDGHWKGIASELINRGIGGAKLAMEYAAPFVRQVGAVGLHHLLQKNQLSSDGVKELMNAYAIPEGIISNYKKACPARFC